MRKNKAPATGQVLKTQNYVKDYFKSPLILAAIVLAGVIIAVFMINAAFAGSVGVSLSEAIYKEFSFLSESGAEVEVSEFSMGLPAVTIVTLIALILIYVKSRNSDPRVSPRCGFTAIWVLALIGFILFLIAGGALIVAAFGILAIPAVGGDFYDVAIDEIADFINEFDISIGNYTPEEIASSAFIVMAIGFLVAAIALIVMALLVALPTMKFTKSVRNSLTTGELSVSCPRLCGSAAIFNAVTSGLSALSLPTSLAFINSREVQDFFKKYAVSNSAVITSILLTTLLSLLSCAMYIVIAKVVLGYRMRVMYATTAPAAPVSTTEVPIYTAPTADNPYAQAPVSTAATPTAEELKATEPVAEAPTIAESTPVIENASAEPLVLKTPEEPITMQNAHPEAKQIVEDAMKAVTKETEED